MEDGEGVLADGTRWRRESGEEIGANGLWVRWSRLSGANPRTKVGRG